MDLDDVRAAITISGATKEAIDWLYGTDDDDRAASQHMRIKRGS